VLELEERGQLWELEEELWEQNEQNEQNELTVLWVVLEEHGAERQPWRLLKKQLNHGACLRIYTQH